MAATTSELTALPAHALSAEIASRRLSPVDVVDALLDRIRSLDPKLNAFVEVYAGDARLAAEAADKAIRSGHAVGPLHGVPIALKDLVEIEGRVTTGGSMAWRDRRSSYTATLATRLIKAGMIVIGKTHSVEFALGLWGTNQHMGTPRNPWDATRPRTPGGSSSGSGVAVAARLVPWAIGTDTGGSVRLPASFCGVTGLKATIGRISTYGVLPISPTLDTPGPITRSVEDAAILYRLLHGPDPRDHRTLNQPDGDVLPGLKRGIRGLRLARMPEVEREGVSAEVLAAYEQSLEVLAGLGALIEEVPLPRRLDDYAELTNRILLAEGYSLYGEIVDDDRLPIDAAVRQRLRLGAGISARDYLSALRLQNERKQEFAAALANYDALLTPTTWTAALPLDSIDDVPVPARFTRFVNLLELCGIALPNGFTAEGLPTSLQIVGRGHDEATVLRIAWAYQAATDWHQRTPPAP
ncbi:amidase [Roseomonas sp. M0104]|uniref:Amidase n=1 Tax=Teichococcus coralli TaxID=2545983 RepID=A0A845BLK2_9PROT|nr:amidase [Pseudoroseomonas coralli]MXP64289.1 amidase [Pseudoroseomonas coralli]